jgi:hypothetical protein
MGRWQLLLAIALLTLLGGCVSVRPEVVESERLILQNVQAAARNQERIIEAYAEDQKRNVVTLMESSVIDQVITERAGGASQLTLAQVKALLIEYATDLNNEFAEIETKKADLLATSRDEFATLEAIIRSNIEYLESLVALTESQNNFLGRNRERLDNVEADLLEVLGDSVEGEGD